MNRLKRRNGRPILVTGAHRSGSTWVGRMLATSPAVAYIHEPFNLDPLAGSCAGYFENWFTYVCESNAHLHYEHVRDCLDFKYRLAKRFGREWKPRHIVRAAREWASVTYRRLQRKRPLVKDPIAIFSAEWLAQTFAMDVIVLIRHPAAFAGSLKQAHWIHPFRHFLNQPLLLRDHLSDFVGDIEAFATRERDIVDQAILLWNMMYATVLKYRRRQPAWCFVRHEDIAADPLTVFGRLFLKVDLDYSPAVRRAIVDFSSPVGAEQAEDKLFIRRDSESTIWSWKERLSRAEIDRVREGTRRVSDHFYADEEW